MIFQQRKYSLEVDINKLRSILNVEDNRTIKTAFKNLVAQGYILNNVEIVKRKPSTVAINKKKIEKGNQYTQLPTALIGKVDSIGHRGIRLLYYYESYVNRSSGLKQFAYPGFKRICIETSVNQDTLDKYNDILIKEKLLKVQKHDPEHVYENEEDEIGRIHKHNNHYEVRLDNILKL